jgi:LPXTG-site transpeptidase (sortase) family protein
MTLTESPRAVRDGGEEVPRAASGDIERALSDLTDASRSESFLRYTLRTSLMVLAMSALALVFLLTVVSGLEYRAAQNHDFNALRKELAEQTAPCPGCQGQTGAAVRTGTPIAILTIPALHLQEVVVEGTSGEDLTSGPGHLRDTVWPGGAGTSVILGRQAAYGGPFGRIHELRPGEMINVVTAYGHLQFEVIDVRKAHDPEPAAPRPGTGRLTLITAAGTPFAPEGLVYVDSSLVGPAKAAPAAATSSVQGSELPMGSDTSTVWALAFFLEALLVLLVVAVWSWRHWGRGQTWIVFVPLIGLAAYYIADQVTRLLPNLI